MSARSSAESALRGYLSDPGGAQQLATAALADALARRDWATASLAARALGRVAGHLADSPAAHARCLEAVRYARWARDPVAVARARTDLAYVLVRQGRSRQALRQVELARPDLEAAEAGDLLTTSALVLKSLGRWDEAFEVYRQAVPVVRSTGDSQALALLLGNRGVVQLYRGRLAGADRDLREAEALLAGLPDAEGQELSRAIVQHNLGYLAALRNEVPGALQHYQRAEEGYARHREVPLELWRDQCELLLATGLASEARVAAERAVEAARSRVEAGELAEAQLRLAQAALAEADPDLALGHADEALRAFTLQRRASWAALARWAGLEARLALRPGTVTGAQLRQAADALERAGWTATSGEARLQAAVHALARGRRRRGLEDLQRLRALRRGGPVWNRHLGWHAEALMREQDGDPPGALRAAARGLRLVEDYRDTLGATDLRAAASGRASSLAELGLRIALRQGGPATVLAWAERTRAAALLRPAVRPTGDPVLEADLAELRQVMSRRKESLQAGRGDPELLERQVALEQAIRARTRATESASGAGRSRTPRRAELAAALGERALVEYARCDGELVALTLVAGRLRLFRLGPVEAVERELHYTYFALRRLVVGASRGLESLRESADRMDAILLAPLLAEIGDRALVVVPTDPLHAMPWSTLPSCAGRAVSVSPSATIWHAAHAAPPRPDGRVLLVAGPDLVHAEAEVRQIALGYPRAEVLTGVAATVDGVLQRLEGTDLVHIAAHGRFRSDNPQFSAIELADGPLTVYDMERVQVPPSRMVLSACELGRSAVSVGDELLGMASAVLALGVRSLVAPLLLVPDAETAPLMVALHRELVSSSFEEARSMSSALARAAATEEVGRAPSGPERAAAGAFVSVGV